MGGGSSACQSKKESPTLPRVSLPLTSAWLGRTVSFPQSPGAAA